MTARQEIRKHAEMFKWQCHADDRRRQDTLVCGQHMIAVNYRRDGAVNEAQRYVFNRVSAPRLEEIAKSQDKKASVVYWLIKLGH